MPRVSEIVRRRLFGKPARHETAVARQFAVGFNRARPVCARMGTVIRRSNSRQFEACYSVQPATLTVFQRKWQALAQYQQTRSTLAMLGMWISVPTAKATARLRRESLLYCLVMLCQTESCSPEVERLQAAIYAT